MSSFGLADYPFAFEVAHVSFENGEFMLHGVVLASHHSACKCATDVLFTPSSDLLAGIGQAMTGIGVTVMETGVTVMGTGVAVMGTGVTDAGDWSDCGGDCCDKSRDWSGCVTVAVIQIYLTG